MADMTKRAVAAVLDVIDRNQWTKAEVVERTGISFKTIDRLIEERVLPTRRDKRRELAVGIGWPADGIERLLAGADPGELVAQHAGDDEDWNPVVSVLSDETKALIRQMSAEVRKQRGL